MHEYKIGDVIIYHNCLNSAYVIISIHDQGNYVLAEEITDKTNKTCVYAPVSLIHLMI